MSKKIRIGIVGGGIGKQHLDGFRNLPDMFEVAGFCDLNPAQRDKYQNEYGVPFVTDSFDVLCARADIDVIDICTPPFLHFAQVLQALQAGKDVICEKPITASVAEVDEIEKVCAQTGRHVLPVYQYRYGHGLQKLLHLKNAGVLGKAYMASVEVAWKRGADYFAVPWRGKMATHLGGCLLDQSIHMHDLLEQVMGKAVAVTARTRTRVNPVETEDCAAVILEFEDGSMATETVTLGATEEKTRLRFFFENMTISSDHDRPYKPQEDPWTFVPRDGVTHAAMEKAMQSFKPAWGGYEGLFSQYHAALTTGSVLPVTLEDAKRSIGLVSAMYYAAAYSTGVNLPLPADNPFYDGWNKPAVRAA